MISVSCKYTLRKRKGWEGEKNKGGGKWRESYQQGEKKKQKNVDPSHCWDTDTYTNKDFSEITNQVFGKRKARNPPLDSEIKLSIG